MKNFNFENQGVPMPPREKEADESDGILLLDEDGEDTELGLDLEAQHQAADEVMEKKLLEKIEAKRAAEEAAEIEKAREEDREELERTFRRF